MLEEPEIIIGTPLEGLCWRKNLVAQSTDHFVHVIESSACGVVDTLHHYQGTQAPSWLSLHLGQVDLLTFFGDPDQIVRGVFIDCRKNSKTLHRRVDLAFSPDPKRHLLVERGIGHAIFAKDGITVRVEALLFVSKDAISFDVQNDSMNFRVDEEIQNFPVVEIALCSLPPEVPQFILTTQQQAISEGGFKHHAARMMVGGKAKTIHAERRN